MIDKRPAAIARCRDVADVISCVRFGREHGAEIAVRGGGHNAAGLGVGDGALVIDLSLLRSTTVDPADHTVRADAGCTWADVDHATVAFGMATPSGFLASTGVAGLTLGGGIGYLSRRFDLTVDNLLAADVVLADGTFVTASDSSHRDPMPGCRTRHGPMMPRRADGQPDTVAGHLARRRRWCHPAVADALAAAPARQLGRPPSRRMQPRGREPDAR